jgi:hypothetical protein
MLRLQGVVKTVILETSVCLYTAQHPRRQSSSFLSPWEPDISHRKSNFTRCYVYSVVRFVSTVNDNWEMWGVVCKWCTAHWSAHVFRYCLSDIVNRKNGSHSAGDTACDLTFRMGRNFVCRGRLHHKIKQYWKGFKSFYLDQPFSIFLPWRNPWNNFQVSGNPCI